MGAREQFTVVVRDHVTPWLVGRGYTVSKKRLFTKKGGLLRTIRVDPGKYVDRRSYDFALMLNLGVPGLTWVTLTQWDWGLNLAVHGQFPWKQARRFELVEGADPGPVAEAALSALDEAFQEFWDEPVTPEDLIGILIGDQDRLDHLQVFPPNAFGRAVLAAGIARHLGRSAQVEELKARVADCATIGHVEHLLPGALARIDAVEAFA
ncbi:hypothetical protein [Actinokineospora bangkokensis]|uniref:DUF4304 domain-containing protein n=1 Tax=Actinokineospora bangkokensis TaxID=1193682 RepID=A0A1Q9LKT5_9PSEU|nr:hypothetical protein [Actinokineospora bangkokensis]OLR92613.1 hypothetical protein BJP25_21425 [Actinokineospora bangkokensis]